MRQPKEKKINTFFYILSILALTGLFLGLYSLLSSNKEKNPGFSNANSIINNKDICIGGKKNIECQKKLLANLSQKNNSILFLGNSQTGAINHYKLGENTFISLLNEKAKISRTNIEAKAIWLPNANLREFEIILMSLKSCNVKPDILFLPIFLDDLRLNSIRNELDSYQFDLCNDLLKRNQKENLSINLVESKSNIENLNYKIKSKLSIFNKINSLNEKLRVDIYKLRNFIFNIKPTSIRRVKRAAYQDNIMSLMNILDERKIGKLKTFIYIPPLLNSDNKGPIPYDKNEYSIFKNELKNICKTEKCIYLNLEKSVPNEFWGLKSSTTFNKDKLEIDFMHFTEKGHNILSEKLLDILIANIKSI